MLFLAPYLGDGGINTHMLTLGKELKKLGWDVAICSGGSLGEVAKDAPTPEDYDEAGIPHFRAWIPASPIGSATSRSCSSCRSPCGR